MSQASRQPRPGYEHCNLSPEIREVFAAARRAWLRLGSRQQRVMQELIPGQVQALSGYSRYDWRGLVRRGLLVPRRDELWELSELGVIVKQAGLGTRWAPRGSARDA